MSYVKTYKVFLCSRSRILKTNLDVHAELERLNYSEAYLRHQISLAIWSEEVQKEWKDKLADVTKAQGELVKLIRTQ